MSLASSLGRSNSLVARIRSGAPVSSELMWAQLEQTTASWGPGRDDIIVASAAMLAPVPLKVRRVTTSRSNNSSKDLSQAAVKGSFP